MPFFYLNPGSSGNTLHREILHAYKAVTLKTRAGDLRKSKGRFILNILHSVR